MRDHKFDNRRYIVAAIILVVAIVYIARLFSLQVLDKQYRKSADSNALYHRTVVPSRGVIYDRNGEIMVSNSPSYNVTVVTREIAKDFDTLAFCRSLEISPEFFVSRMAEIRDRRRNPGFSNYTSQIFMSQLRFDEIAVLQEELYRFKGFSIERGSFRLYNFSVAGHLLGDVAEVSRSDLEKDSYYVPGDFIGKQGVEKQYEKYLRGEKGDEILLKDAVGRIQGHYLDGALDKPSRQGSNLTLTIDVKLQQLGERLMKNKVGAIVAIEPSTGEVLCMVSAPTFDPSSLVGRHRSENYIELTESPMRPLLNRSIMGTYPPGSTFKTAQALVQLNEGIITDKTMLNCNKGFVHAGLRMGCHAHAAPLDLRSAIATSCNGYFGWSFYYMIGSSKYKNVQQAITVWKDYMVDMGFGYALGIDLPGEKRGMIPNADFYDRAYNKHWNALTIISNSIGQGEVTLTPLQIANLGATIANRGYYITPHVVKDIEGYGIDTTYTVKHRVGIDPENYELVIEGMRQSVLSGTCASANTSAYELCGKTGTAQNKGKDHSAFMGFAPKDNPQIAIVVYVENGGFGATFGVPIGSLLIEQYLTGTLSEASIKKAEDIENRVIAYAKEK